MRRRRVQRGGDSLRREKLPQEVRHVRGLREPADVQHRLRWRRQGERRDENKQNLELFPGHFGILISRFRLFYA